MLLLTFLFNLKIQDPTIVFIINPIMLVDWLGLVLLRPLPRWICEFLQKMSQLIFGRLELVSLQVVVFTIDPR